MSASWPCISTVLQLRQAVQALFFDLDA